MCSFSPRAASHVCVIYKIMNKEMKKLTLTLALVGAMLTGAYAQQQGGLTLGELPLDPNVRMGKLDNGLTYFIRHNEWPEQRADFYIAQKVGSMQEEDDQRGLAHFLEHMCFNGTKHFPGNGLKTYLESIGIKFGADLNAYTSFDETVYNINNVPVISNPQAIDSCLLILHDWSNALALEGTEIDKERGVINEEWRMRSSAQQRMQERAFPVLYEGSKYAYRMPIGTMDVVMNFPYEAIRSYYRKWYRPDLQAIVIVGDVDVDAIESKIKDIFADIKAPVDPAERVYFDVPDYTEPIVCIEKDKEQDRSIAYIMWQHKAMPREIKNTAVYYLQNYIVGAIDNMISMRLAEIAQKENPPFMGAQVVYNDDYLVSKTKDACLAVTVFKDNGHKEAIEALYREYLRAKRFGFTVSEYERYKESYKANIENMYERRNKISNSSYVDEYVRFFLDNVAAAGIEWEHTNLINFANEIPLEAINEQIMQPEKLAPIVFAMMPDKEGIVYPTKEEILDIMKAVEAEEIEAYKEEVSNEPLVDESLLKGSKVKKEEKADFDFTHLTLANGINIYVRKTDFSPNNITMMAQSWGGSSLYDDSEYMQVAQADGVGLGGWGNFSAIELSKKLAGKKASVNSSIGMREESISGSCVTKDFETMLQLTYLAFTSPRRDDEVYNSTMQRTKQSLANADLEPTTALRDTIVKAVYNNDVRALRFKADDVDKLDYTRMLQIYKERFADADDFDFFFIGDIDIEQAKPLFEKYLGSLPTQKGSEKFKPCEMRVAKGMVKNVFEKEQETPSAIVLYVWHTPMKYSQEASVQSSFLRQILQMVFTEKVREDEGGAYSIGVSGGLTEYPEEYAMVQIQLPTAPDKREYLTDIIYRNIEQMCQEGPSDEDMQKVREYMLRSYDESIKTNGYWLGAIENKVRLNRDTHGHYLDIVNRTTKQEVQNMAKKIFQSGNRIEVGMTSPQE